MGEQKNLFLAIGLSVAIIVIFQLFTPTNSYETNRKWKGRRITNYFFHRW